MPKFRITDHATGHSIVVSGNEPPSPDEVGALFQQAGVGSPSDSASTQTQSSQQNSNPLMDFLGAISKPFRQVGQAAMDLGMAGGYGAEKLYGATNLPQMGPIPSAQQVSQNADRAMVNAPHPLLSDSENQQAMDHPVETGLKAGAGVGSYMMPFGQGANIATKVIAPAAATGALSGASQDNANPGSVTKDAGLSTLLSLIFHGAGSAISKVADPVANKLQDAGSGFLRSQYTGANKNLEQGGADAINTLASKYGITNINDIARVAPQVSGPEGAVLSDVVRNAVSKAGPVDIGSISKMTQDLLDNAYSIPDAQAKKIMDMVKKGVSSSAITEGDQGISNADPQKVFQLIQDLGGEASKNYNAFSRSGDVADQQIAGVMTQLKRELQDRLFGGFDSTGAQTGKGADAAIPQFTEDQLNTLHQISPQLAHDAVNAKNIGDLRALQRPFVAASQAAQHSLDRAGSKPINGFESIALLLNPHLWPVLATTHALNSNMGKSAMGKAAIKAGQTLEGAGAPSGLQALLDLLGARTGAAVGNSTQSP